MRISTTWICLSCLLVAGVGCAPASAPAPAPAAAPAKATAATPADKEAAEREEALSKLDPADRKLAEAQGYCALSGEPLGSMGPPVKVALGDDSVFVCCEGCSEGAAKNPEKTLERVAKFKAKVEKERAK